MNRENRLLIVILTVLAAGVLVTSGLTVYLAITHKRGDDLAPTVPSSSERATDTPEPTQVTEITTRTRSTDGM